VTVTAKRFEYRTQLAPDGTLTAESEEPLATGGGWTAEHLVLAGLARCLLTSLRYYARGASVDGAVAAWCVVTLRAEDERFAIVEIEADLDVTIDPEPPPDRLPALLAHAEQGCFVGNSLRAKPRYRWTVNGRPATA
jgi:organic hydroperoxide reductase OsmC/OhrA